MFGKETTKKGKKGNTIEMKRLLGSGTDKNMELTLGTESSNF